MTTAATNTNQPSFPPREEVKLEQVLTGDGGMRYYTAALSFSACLSTRSLSLARSHVLDFFYRRKLNERKKKVFPPPLLHFCSILPTFWLPKLADGAKSYRNKPGTLFFPVRQKTPLCAFITFCSLQASYKHTILCTAEDTSHISSVCQADLYKAERSQTFDSSLDRMMSPKMSH